MSHSTHVGFKAPLPSNDCSLWSSRSLDRSLPSLRVKAAGLLPLCIVAVGVGQMLRPTTVSKLGKRPGAHADSGVIVAAIAEQLRGVGYMFTAARRSTWTFFPL